MFAFELEHRQVVIELRGCPGGGGMTVGTVHAVTPLVWFILAMAGDAIVRDGLQVGNGAGIEMTICAGHVDMFACQLKCEFIVIEIIPEAVRAIMAGETIRAKGKLMRLGEGNVHLTVAGFAGVGSEDRDVAVMTVITGERHIRSRTLMTVQNKSHHFMGEESVIHYCE